MTKLIDGKLISTQILQELKEENAIWMQAGNRAPHLVAVLVGNNGASLTYVKSKIKACENAGYRSTLIQKEETVSELELLQLIEGLNADNEVDGYIIQLPLPAYINEKKVTDAIDARKDVDGFHPLNFGRMALGMPAYLPATPAGIIELLDRYNIETNGKHCVVLGRSHIVGLPISLLMQRNAKVGNATVTIAHSRTKNLSEITKQADIIVVAIGKPNYLTAEMVKDGVVVIDVGISRIDDNTSNKGYKVVGDVDFDSVAPKSSYITPVPGGVGPMTIAILLKNTMLAAKGLIYE